MTTEERSTLLAAVTDQVEEIARAQTRPPAEVLQEMSNHLRAERFRFFVSRNRAQARANGWNESDVAAWIDEDRNEQRSQ